MEREERHQRFKWSRDLSQEELAVVNEIGEKTQNITLDSGRRDSWNWGSGQYSIKEAYEIIMTRTPFDEETNYIEAWNRFIPLKVAVLVWRLFQNKIASKDNLVKRGVLNQTQSDCPFRCAVTENASHIFFECSFPMQVWASVLRWLNIHTAMHNNAIENYHQFKGLCGMGRMQAEKFCVIWFACIWILWNGRNEKVFRDSSRSAEQMSEEIKIIIWKWLKCKVKGFNYSLNHWITNLAACLGIGC
ncbi:uncharacterized protein LOC131598205 [Vicia villosa]|uniref:uncharacterized protein LOC131598205 n=1 Tax=Vicia villosa TaxID=3911 RepID=UPI00273CE4C3|nr:uncharacterized protein LOC131598205 [Vicia villosa]